MGVSVDMTARGPGAAGAFPASAWAMPISQEPVTALRAAPAATSRVNRRPMPQEVAAAAGRREPGAGVSTVRAVPTTERESGI